MSQLLTKETNNLGETIVLGINGDSYLYYENRDIFRK